MLRRAHGCSWFYLLQTMLADYFRAFSQSLTVQITLPWRLRTQKSALSLLAFSKSVLSCLGTGPCATLPTTPPLARSQRASTRSATLIRRYLGLENDGKEGMGREPGRKEG